MIYFTVHLGGALPTEEPVSTPATTLNATEPEPTTMNYTNSTDYDSSTDDAFMSKINKLHARASKELQEERNKKFVLDFYQEVFGDKNVDAADKYIDATTYIQHNPHVADGREAFKTAIKGLTKGLPKETIDVHHVAGDGNFVFLHLKATKLFPGQVASVMDIFRVC